MRFGCFKLGGSNYVRGVCDWWFARSERLHFRISSSAENVTRELKYARWFVQRWWKSRDLYRGEKKKSLVNILSRASRETQVAFGSPCAQMFLAHSRRRGTRLYIPYSISGDDNDGIIRARTMKVKRFTVSRCRHSTWKRLYSYYTTQIRGVPRRTEVSELLSLRVPYSVISSYSTRIQTLHSLTHVYTLPMYSFSFITHQRSSIIELDRQSAKRSKVARRKRERKPFTRKGSNLRVSVYYKLATAVLRDEREKERKNRAS